MVDNQSPESWILTADGLLAVFALVLISAITAWTLTQWIGQDPPEDDEPVPGQCSVHGCTATATQPRMRADGTLTTVCSRCDEEMSDPRIRG